jgi:hypothetical protein
MSTIWTLIEACLSDANKAEELVASAAGRRELRLDRDSALAGFSVLRGTTGGAARRPSVLRVKRSYATVTVAER